MNKISVIIPVYNCEKYLAEAIESVINQTYNAFEIVVIDDGSKDNSAKIAQLYPQVIYLYKENGGVSSALNFALEKVKGDIIAFLDADDIWTLDKLEKQIQIFNSKPNLDICFGHYKIFTHYFEQKDNEKNILPGYFKATMLIKKESFFRVGLFDETIKMGEFIDWFARAKELNLEMEILKDVLFYRRIHDSNTTLINKENISDFVKIMKSTLDRRRKNEK